MSIFDRLFTHHQLKKPFVIYSKPNQDSVIGLFQNTEELFYLRDYKQQGFIMAPFSGSDPVFIPKSESEVIKQKWEPIDVDFKELPLDYKDEGAKNKFENLVKKGLQAIDNNQFDKIVFSRKEIIEKTDIDVVELYKRLKTSYPMAFCYLFYHPKVGMWMGATPEQLLRIKDNCLFTMALAGTQVDKGQVEVIWEEKEREEQLFVTDFIMDSLKGYLKDISKSEPFTSKAGQVMHIRTDISGTLKNREDLKDILKTLHPTPAVCGIPKEVSKSFILKEEAYDRAYYSGFLGELNFDFAVEDTKATDLFVNLRCMELKEDKVCLYIGCGITKDSDPSSEFIETVNKSSTMKKILQ